MEDTQQKLALVQAKQLIATAEAYLERKPPVPLTISALLSDAHRLCREVAAVHSPNIDKE